MTYMKPLHLDRFISKKELKDLVLYSPSHIARLEKIGAFPRRIQLGPCRVGWSQQEVGEWIEARKAVNHEKKCK